MRVSNLPLAGVLFLSSPFKPVSADVPSIPGATVTSVISGDGPKAPTVTKTAAAGSWAAPTGSMTVKGVSYAPPSMTGMGRQIQVNSATDFCLLMPPDPTTQNLVDAEANAVAYCMNPYNNTRPFPDGFIETAHYRHTPKYVQISGTYNPAIMNLASNDCGGEYDNHGALGVGNPVGAAVDGADNFMQFMGACDIPDVKFGVFCLRACHPSDSSYAYCKNTYDLMGCLWVMPGDYDTPGFTNCEANVDLPVGSYPANGSGTSTSTFTQGAAITPPPVAAPASSQCQSTTSPGPSGVIYYWDGVAAARPTGASSSSGSGSTSSSINSGASSGAESNTASTRALEPERCLSILLCMLGGWVLTCLA